MSEVTCFSKIKQIGYHIPKKVQGTFGIEIETETKRASDYPEGFFSEDPGTGRFKVPMPEWEGHVDNSLRNYGMEFVLRKPLSFDAALKALDSFQKGTEGIPFLKNVPSTSVHVHTNMLNERPSTMANFLALYTLFENVLVDYSGESRRSNLFALPMRVAEATVDNIRDVLQMFQHENHTLFNSSPHRLKYAALNLAPLVTFGSLELRSFRGETDVEEIKDWLRIINNILEYARTPGLTPRIVLFEYKMRGVSYFDEVFKDMSDKVRSKVNDISELIDRNLWYLFRIATAMDDWEALDRMKESTKDKPVEPNFGNSGFILSNVELNQFEILASTEAAGVAGQTVDLADADDLDEIEDDDYDELD